MLFLKPNFKLLDLVNMYDEEVIRLFYEYKVFKYFMSLFHKKFVPERHKEYLNNRMGG
jgi:hypothetical protein